MKAPHFSTVDVSLVIAQQGTKQAKGQASGVGHVLQIAQNKLALCKEIIHLLQHDLIPVSFQLITYWHVLKILGSQLGLEKHTVARVEMTTFWMLIRIIKQACLETKTEPWRCEHKQTCGYEKQHCWFHTRREKQVKCGS